ncbi:hypothetical protein RAN53_09760 [Halomonas sp. SSL-5]|uniref:hypothetical protein n=1 Tax=Halomonas sp. SSL-5 TaxID=3065855 RepID=UPI002739B923|nr:hypothetical protein [Halomonas sp. SSL-5]MDY7116636.1 hypothetical protein [Halomonas sp. SSL-5]
MTSRHTIAVLLACLALAVSQGAAAAEGGLDDDIARDEIASKAKRADSESPAYAGHPQDLMRLDNGVTIDGQDIETPDGYTSGFRLIAGFSPFRLPRLDLAAEFSYRESDEVPTRLGDQQLLVNTVSLGGSLVAGVRLGRFGLYAKSGLVGWEGDAVIPRGDFDEAGTTRVRGFGARLQFPGFTSRLEVEEYDAPDMAHLNLLTASINIPF